LAEDASAIYFASEHEACQSLLSAISRQRPLDAWFWSAISQAGSHEGPATHAVRVIEMLASSPSSWLAVAAAIFAAGNPVYLLALLQAETVRSWLIEMGDVEPASSLYAMQPMPEPLPLTTAAQAVLLETSAVLCPLDERNADPRLLWLACLAVIHTNPGEMSRRSAPATARRAMAMFSSETARQAVIARNNQKITPDTAFLAHEVALTSPPEALTRAKDTSERQDSPTSSPTPHRDLTPEPSPDIGPIQGVTSSASVGTCISTTSNAGHTPPLAEQRTGEMAIQKNVLGKKTDNAGLYFLLNALADLGIHDADVSRSFLARLFQLMATGASIAEDDPILHWAVVALEESSTQSVDQRELRMWGWRVRKWCWRQAKISLRDVVRRPGLVLLTRTDLDISLPLTSVDIRIRRVGLDLDPGWLPWFGRVVRFHYLSNDEFPVGELA
jgi:hypothetical protein